MRTNIEIDDRLMRDALRVSGGKTKRAVVEAALRLAIARTMAQAVTFTPWAQYRRQSRTRCR
jgi:Arc/MetJ family transcription regulator